MDGPREEDESVKVLLAPGPVRDSLLRPGEQGCMCEIKNAKKAVMSGGGCGGHVDAHLYCHGNIRGWEVKGGGLYHLEPLYRVPRQLFTVIYGQGQRLWISRGRGGNACGTSQRSNRPN